MLKSSLIKAIFKRVCLTGKGRQVSAKPSFMSKLPYMIVYLGVIGAFGFGVYFMYNKYQDNEKKKIAEAQQREIALRKEKEEEAARKLQADIERQLAVQKKKEEAYNKAVKYATENPDKPKLVKQYYLDTKEFVKGSEFEALIDQKIAEIKDSTAKGGGTAVAKLDPESERLMQQLEFRAKPYITAKKYMDAVAVYRDYEGPLKKKTATARQEKIDHLYKLSVSYGQEYDIAEKKLQQHLGAIGDYIIDDKLNKALAELEKLAKDPELEIVKDEIEAAQQMLKNISNADKMLEDSLRGDINKTITISTWAGSQAMEIKDVKGSKIYFIKKSGSAKIKESISFSKLNASEILKRLSYMNEPSKYLYAGLCAYKHKKVDIAKEYFAKTGLLSEAILEAVGKVELKKLREKLG